MTKPVLKLEDVIKRAEEIVEELGSENNYINPYGDSPRASAFVKCYYWDNQTGQPSCLVGRILFSFGADSERLKAADTNGESSWGAFNGAQHVAKRFFDPEVGVGTFLDELQVNQDRGIAFGLSLGRAKKAVCS